MFELELKGVAAMGGRFVINEKLMSGWGVYPIEYFLRSGIARVHV
jgi:hypothetical protein